MSICGVLDKDEIEEFVKILTRQTCTAHDPIIDEGEPADFVFNVTGGAVKLFKLLPDGRRQITGFLFEGDFLGIAMNDTYSYSAEAVGDAHMCRFNRRKFEALLDRFPKLERRLLGMASNELAQAQDQMLLLGRKTAREKLCTFLLSLSRRSEKRGYDPSVISVPMSRNDIGDYLGLTTETVSRTFTNLKKDGVIRLLEGNRVKINDAEQLQDLAEGA
ncbi:helix-turn-helix domain-containing protein [Rhodospirillaceae bacterium KN72]|uniref:Helix-turn-helix domain-containing protein n=2 Tax=Pacificispira spongiicola TaxID=2729598 RepID=A0A7Y0HFY1_9PROT|nr:helix-turn-helix domain-containing protein [Pacificispira spongiicola]